MPPTDSPNPTPETRRRAIMRQVQEGALTPEEGLAQLNALESETFEHIIAEPPMLIDAPADGRGAGAEEDTTRRYAEIDRDIQAWRRFWVIPLWVGVGITLLGGLLIAAGYRAAGMSWGFWLAWIPFWLGVLIMSLGWWSRSARWLHVRVQEGAMKHEHPSNINFSLPLPFGLAAWFLRTFGRWIPQVQGQNIGEVLSVLDGSLSKDEPFYVKVDDEDGGDHVEVYIG